MLLQAILLGLVAMLGNAEYLFGTSLLSRPLVMGTLTGIVLGEAYREGYAGILSD